MRFIVTCLLVYLERLGRLRSNINCEEVETWERDNLKCASVLAYTHMHVKNQITLKCYIALVGFVDKFWIQSKSTSQGVSYDFRSIMHFRHKAFSRSRNESTIVPRSRTISKTMLGSSVTATDLDFIHLNLLYCGGTDAKFLHCCEFCTYLKQLCLDFTSMIQ